ncbi:MAG: M23 family metallopeptidase [Muribaculaceae bacterium]|nr:M23 family metallopeptidase [Muribaculaceae bacterium]
MLNSAKLLIFLINCNVVSRKVYYRYNPLTEAYERVYRTRHQRILSVVLRTGEVVAVAVVFGLGLYALLETPREKLLRSDNEHLRSQVAELDQRLNAALDVMDNLAERDNNFYRIMMQADPISDVQRYAGIDLDEPNIALNSMNDAALVGLVTRKIQALEQSIYTQIGSFDQLRDLAFERQDYISHVPSIQPVANKDLRQMASGYGRRVDPIYGTVRFHEGMDFSAPIGTPVYATGDGVVKVAGRGMSGYGNVVDIDHGFNYMTRYAHLDQVLVKPGQEVKRGDLIGKVGNTGKSTGSHLHYEVRLKGVPQNPVNYYFQDLSPDEYAAMIEAAENAGHVMD